MVKAIINKTIWWMVDHSRYSKYACQIPSDLLQFWDPNVNRSKWLFDKDKHPLTKSVFDGLLFGERLEELYFSCMISHQSQRIVLTRLNTHSVFLPAPLSIHLSGPLARKYLYPVVRFGWQFLHPQSSVAVLCRCWHAQQSHIMLLVVLVNGAAWHKMKSVYKV